MMTLAVTSNGSYSHHSWGTAHPSGTLYSPSHSSQKLECVEEAGPHLAGRGVEAHRGVSAEFAQLRVLIWEGNSDVSSWETGPL